MSDLREAAQQALAVINDTAYGAAVYRKEVRDVIAALRAALKQDEPVEPVEEQVTYPTGGIWLDAGFYFAYELRGICKALDSMNAAARRTMRKRTGGGDMTRDDIIRMARETGFALYVNDVTEEPHALTLERFADLVAAAEREACAKVCDEMGNSDTNTHAWDAAAAIRARGTDE